MNQNLNWQFHISWSKYRLLMQYWSISQGYIESRESIYNWNTLLGYSQNLISRDFCKNISPIVNILGRSTALQLINVYNSSGWIVSIWLLYRLVEISLGIFVQNVYCLIGVNPHKNLCQYTFALHIRNQKRVWQLQYLLDSRFSRHWNMWIIHRKDRQCTRNWFRSRSWLLMCSRGMSLWGPWWLTQCLRS